MTVQENGGVWLVDPKESRLGYWLIHAMGALQLFGAGALLLQGQTVAGWSFAAVLLLSGALFLVVAGTLGARKGGIQWLPGSGNVRVFGRNAADVLELPAGELAGLRVVRRQEYWGRSEEPVFVCSVELERVRGTSLLLLEFPNLEDAQDAAHTFRGATGWKLLGEEDAVEAQECAAPRSSRGLTVTPEGGMTRLRLHPGMRYALSSPTVTLGLFSLVTGVLLLLGVEATGVLGFLFGPFLGALGLACIVWWSLNALGGQHLLVAAGTVGHGFRLGAWRLGQGELPWKGGEARTRLRTRAALGFSLELVAGNRIVAVGSGATRKAALEPHQLVAVGDWLHTQCAK
jgi:hypothetical protein